MSIIDFMITRLCVPVNRLRGYSRHGIIFTEVKHMKKKPLCKQFAKDVCDILHIDAPKIEFVSSDQMRTDTQIAALIPCSFRSFLIICDNSLFVMVLFSFRALSHRCRQGGSYRRPQAFRLFNYCVSPNFKHFPKFIFLICAKSSVFQVENCVISVLFIDILNEVVKTFKFFQIFQVKQVAFYFLIWCVVVVYLTWIRK